MPVTPLSTTRTVANTPAEHASDHNTAHERVNTLYPIYETGQRLWVPAGAMHAVEGSPALAVVGTTRFAGYALDAAADEALGFFVAFPDDWASFSARAYVVGAGTGNGCYDLQRYNLETGDNSTTATFTSDTVTVAHSFANLVYPANFAGGVVSGVTAFRFVRDANNAADTLTGDSHILGIYFQKAS